MESTHSSASPTLTAETILCCQCGIRITPNATNMCIECVRTSVDITEGIPTQATIHFCKNCERYLQPPNQWISAALESRELLSICLKRLKGLKNVCLIDSSFEVTEPNSKRIKVKLTIQKEVMDGAVLKQVLVVELAVQNQMCDDCRRTEASDFLTAVVQVRQKATHKKTMYYLEQAILKHKAHANTLNIKEVHDGIDFYFGPPEDRDPRKFVHFLQTVVPCRYEHSKRIVSQDYRNNTYNSRSTFSVEIAPICKDDIICLPPKVSASLSQIGQIVICLRVTTSIHLINPTTLQMADVGSVYYWKNPFVPLATSKQLQEYIVMQVECIDDIQRNSSTGAVSNKHDLADVWVSRANDMSSDQIHCRSHLGRLLQPGDTVLGFDLLNSNVNNYDLDKIPSEKRPDVILVKKLFADKSYRNQQRRWRLNRLEREADASVSSNERDYTDFMEDLEEDEALRQNVNIYKDPQKMAVEVDPDTPQITLEELLDDLTLTEYASETE